MESLKFSVKVRVTSWFKKYTKGATELILEVTEGTTAIGLLKALEIPRSEVGAIMRATADNPEERARVDETYLLEENDYILLIPHILGG